jgi:hypothetical protein
VKSSDNIAIVRKRNQITLPAEAVLMLGLSEGDRIIIELSPGDQVATLRPVRRSYAGLLKGVYGDASDYTEAERDAWR